MNPLDWKGPEFLGAYTVFMFAVYFALEIYRYVMSRPAGAPEAHDLDLDVYEVAVLDSRDTALRTALVALVHGKALSFEDGELSATGPLPPKSSRLERVVHKAVGDGGYSTMGALKLATSAEVDRLEESMRRRGFLLTDEQKALVLNGSRLLFLGSLLLGVLKVLVGLSRGKAVGILVMEIFVMGLFGLMLLSRSGWRTRRGDKALNLLRIRHAPLRTTASTGGTGQTLTAGNVVLAGSLYGLGALALLDAHPLRDYLLPPSGGGGGGGGGGDSGSSCSSGSSSCSGGSSCGGGGGCGGCGGGGD